MKTKAWKTPILRCSCRRSRLKSNVHLSANPEEMESEEELVRREGPPHSAVQTDDSAYDGPQLVEDNSRSADDSSSPPQMPPSPLDDGIEVADEFIFGENVQEAQSGEAEYKALVDDFHANKLPAQPKMSAFAPLDSPAEADHDAFKVATPRKVERSGFAPMDTQIEAGHDAFRDQPASNSRPSKAIKKKKRSIGVKNSAAGSAVASAPTNSTKQGGEEDDDLAVCRQMFAHQLVCRASTENANGKACAQHEVPAGCRQFYLPCVNGRQLRRQCPGRPLLRADHRDMQAKDAGLHLPTASTVGSSPGRKRGRTSQCTGPRIINHRFRWLVRRPHCRNFWLLPGRAPQPRRPHRAAGPLFWLPALRVGCGADWCR